MQILDDSSHKALVVAGAWILLPTAWFEYMDTTAMPLFVTAQIVKRTKADRLAFEVKMIGDGVPSITVNYYVEKHPQAYAGMEERYRALAHSQRSTRAPGREMHLAQRGRARDAPAAPAAGRQRTG